MADDTAPSSAEPEAAEPAPAEEVAPAVEAAAPADAKLGSAPQTPEIATGGLTSEVKPTPAPTEPEQTESSPVEAVPAKTAHPEAETAQNGQNEPFVETPSSRSGRSDSARDRNYLMKGPAARKEKVRQRLAKIMDVLNEKASITNDEVEKLLRVSDATATRYLEQLEKEGRVVQIGKTGRGVLYRKR